VPVFRLDERLIFPPPHLAEDGLLAVGGDLSTDRLLLAYATGIFPWYERQPILWHSPDPRMVLFPGELHVPRSLEHAQTGEYRIT
jgi:leucyl/phenylalanyl-tRNA--protein transferase